MFVIGDKHTAAIHYVLGRHIQVRNGGGGGGGQSGAVWRIALIRGATGAEAQREASKQK